MSESVSNLIGAFSLAIADRIEDAAAKVLQRSGETPAAVVTIGFEPGLTNDRLRRILRLSHPGTVRLVDRLVADGLVERRSGRDGREIALHLTRSGMRSRAKFLGERQGAIGSVLAILSDGEQAELGRLLSKMLETMPHTEIDKYTICRLCDSAACSECPLPMEHAA
jgi:DNA-binding MarR family transcriptional regulator